ncbi:tol-pal system protein YbgF [Aurantimonas marianensis]|uniref:Cell division coordinator CpoB n=1 Tax=Aurantimonas marianensis TaxID=2920428 RepID=A0A9X2H549_9HYPH|nr:tol-pal system protein YbgF [Aurantimonas marianensis]MCP3054306.1 tol-pal system protein YbgF [Aurantimonas marianensis]
MTCRPPILVASCLALLMGGTSGASAYEPAFGLIADRTGAQAAFVDGNVACSHRERPVLLAQAGDAIVRLNHLEEEIRRLNGKVEELSFQLLQAQEDMRKRQEDYEFRFQEIEKGTGSGSAGERRGDATPAADSAPVRTAARESAPAAAPSAAGHSDPAKDPSSDDGIGRILDGGLDMGAANAPTGNPPDVPATGSSSTVAAVTPEGAGDLYALAYNYLLAGDYQLAEQSFRQYAQTYPNAEDTPDAEYWLGESLFQQQKYADAAETFLEAQKNYPKSGKAPDMMLKLGMSLAKLDNRETACVTFKEVARRYPNMSATVKSKLADEAKAANC